MHVQLQGMGILKNAKMYKKGERNNTYLTKKRIKNDNKDNSIP